jgi:hypothetical protein
MKSCSYFLAKEAILTQEVLPSLKELISFFADAEQQARGQGVLLSSTSSSVTGAHYQEVRVCSSAVIAGVLACGALFAQEVELDVIAGVVITSNTLLEAGSALYSIGAGIVC